MAGFDFSLERLLRVRESIRKKAAREVRRTQQRIDEVEEEIERLEHLRESAGEGDAGDQNAADLRAKRHIMEALDQHLVVERKSREALEGELREARAELEEAYGEERALEILRERALSAHTIAERRAAQKEIDEIARTMSDPRRRDES